jgi:hypothetical protein
VSDFAKEVIDAALAMDASAIQAVCIEVAKKAVNGKGTDVPRAIISHVLREQINKRAPIMCDTLINVLTNNSLLTPAEQANNFIILLGEYLSSPGAFFDVAPADLSAPLAQETLAI